MSVVHCLRGFEALAPILQALETGRKGALLCDGHVWEIRVVAIDSGVLTVARTRVAAAENDAPEVGAWCTVALFDEGRPAWFQVRAAGNPTTDETILHLPDVVVREARLHRRLSIPPETRVHMRMHHGQQTWFPSVADLSKGGAKLAFSRGAPELERGELARVHLRLDGDVLDVVAMVMWRTDRHLGVCFTPSTPRELDPVDRILTRLWERLTPAPVPRTHRDAASETRGLPVIPDGK